MEAIFRKGLRFYTLVKGFAPHGFLSGNVRGCVSISAVNYANLGRW